MSAKLALLVRRLIGAAVSGVVAMGLLSFGSGRAPAAAATAAPVPVALRGEGAWSTFEEIVPWHNQLAAAKAPIDLGFVPNGSFLGRQDLLAGSVDFALSGLPGGFTTAELAAHKHKASDFVDAPVAVSTLGFLTMAPITAHPGFQTFTQRCDPNGDPSEWPPDVTDPFDPVHGCFIWAAYSGAIKIPNQNLAAMMFQYQLDEHGGAINEPLSSWNQHDVLAAFGVDNLQSVPPKRGPTPVLRSDQDETNYFLQQFASRFAPAVWAGLHVVDPKAKWDPITEALPRQASASRGEADQQAELLGPPSDPANSGVPVGGAIADIPPSALIAVKSTYPKANVTFAELQNANGDWVAPTPDAIDAAVNAGGDTPLYAFDHKAAGAYPFVWVDHLYAPAHGLSIAKTEALATLIRYLASAGQAAAKPVGEGTLPASLAAQAFASADALVRSNCTGADRVIVKGNNPGPFAPAGTALAGVSSMLHCEAAPAPTTTSTTSATTTTTATTVPASTGTVAPLGSSSATTPVPPSVARVVPTTVARTSAAPSTTTLPAKPQPPGPSPIVLASHLPLDTSNGTTGVDRFGAVLLGAGLYFLLRKPATRLFRRVFA